MTSIWSSVSWISIGTLSATDLVPGSAGSDSASAHRHYLGTKRTSTSRTQTIILDSSHLALMSRMTGEGSALVLDQFGYGKFSRVGDGEEKWREDFTMNCSSVMGVVDGGMWRLSARSRYELWIFRPETPGD